jgi:hypothetical protein
MVYAIGRSWRIASIGHMKRPVDGEGNIQSCRCFLQLVWQLEHVESTIVLIESINSWIQVVVDYNLNVCILCVILVRRFGRIRPQDRAMALDWSTNLASISCDFGGGGRSRQALCLHFWRHVWPLFPLCHCSWLFLTNNRSFYLNSFSTLVHFGDKLATHHHNFWSIGS